ncbi:T9SS type A sorting domain-containing protein [Pontibacter arcticus]|nr:T9SS type A sorting domain-containing protein [Pontibacter arcticus]
MKISTKIFLMVTLLSTQLLGTALDARCNAIADEAAAGVAPAYKGGATLWKLQQQEPKSTLTVSATNAKLDAFFTSEKHTCSTIYASAVSDIFHTMELKANKSMYKAVAMASFAPGRDIKNPTINAYPNPSHGVTRFTLNQNSQDNYRIRISNTIGKVVQSADLPASGATNMYEFDLSTLPSGIYFYSLLVNDKTIETKRLILQK